MPLATNSLERALKILELIGNTPGGLSNLEISRHFKIARSTCSYILSRLEKEGYLTRSQTKGRRYRMGLKTVILGHKALDEAGFRVASEPTLYRLATETGLAANLAVLDGERVLVLDRIEGPAFLKAAVQESSKIRRSAQSPVDRDARQPPTRELREAKYELPICSTALGRVLLAHLPAAQFEQIVGRVYGKENSESVEKRALLAELAAVRQHGYCIMSFEPHNESCALAAPIFDAQQHVKAAVSVSCKRHLAIWNDEKMLSNLVMDAAWEISCKLHYPRLIAEARSGRLHTGGGVEDGSYKRH